MMKKPSVLVARAIFPEVLQQLQSVFDVDHNQDDEVFTPAQLHARASLSCWSWLASPSPPNASRPIRTSCPAVSASG